ncbi:HTH domain-containing protein [Clostridium oceanicum]|uniref:Transposase n=1 Tax=Clostridium oceanicum TaxID=1543 RepID=A0ABP3UJI3_9CLOT
MSNKLFSKEEIRVLSKNKYVKKVTSKAITYTDEFKRIFIKQNKEGKTSKEIFKDKGFDIKVLGIHRIDSSGKRWRSTYRKGGINNLEDGRKYNGGRQKVNIKKQYIKEKEIMLKLKSIIEG